MVNPHASALGKIGGKAKSEKKTKSCRLNGVKGAAKRWAGHIKKSEIPVQQSCVHTNPKDSVD